MKITFEQATEEQKLVISGIGKKQSIISFTDTPDTIKNEVKNDVKIIDYLNAVKFYGIKCNHNMRESTHIKHILQKQYIKTVGSRIQYKDNAYYCMKRNK